MTRRDHRLTTAAGGLGGGLVVWSAIPSEPLQDAFYVFIFFYGPAFLFSLAVSIYFVRKHRQYHVLWLVFLSPLIYYGGMWVASADRYWAGVWYVAGTLAAWAYLAVTKMLVCRFCSWSLVLGWGSLSALAALPFIYSIRTLGEGALGNFWFWGLHIFLWYIAVAYAIEKMADQSINRARQRGGLSPVSSGLG